MVEKCNQKVILSGWRMVNSAYTKCHIESLTCHPTVKNEIV